LTFNGVIGVAIFHLERERAAGGVEAVDRIAGDQCQPIDRALRDQIPIDDITENFVDANPVLIDGKSLRRPNDWRGRITPVVQVQLKIVSGLAAERHSRQSPGQ
jgi:hypothetical protein